MRKALASVSVLAVSAAYVWSQGTLLRPDAAATAAVPPAQAEAAPVPAAAAPAAEPAVVAQAPAADLLMPAGPRMKDGHYSGRLSDARFGQVVAELDVVDGRIATLQASRYPDHQQISRRISEEALATIYTELIENQARKMDVVTGATYTSNAFFRSLVSAMRDAQRQNK